MNDVYINILQDSKDPHYRYKMPKLTAKVEGSGNGIKTVITNMAAIAKALGRPPAYPTKYFGCELGAQVTMTTDFVVNGSHDPEKLLNLLYGFIRKFVLCPKCKNPETTLTVVGQTIHQKCIACGHSNTIDKSIHKLTTYIINHPADASTASSTAKGGKSSSSSAKADKKSSKKGHSSSPTNGSSASPANGDGGHQDNSLQNLNNNNEDDFDDFDDEELTSTAYQERMRELCDGLNSDMYLSDTKENANLFFVMVKEKKEAGQLQDAAVQKQLVSEAERLRIKDKATLILSELLFSENIVDEIKTHRMLLLRFCNENQRAQKYLLGGFEKLVGDVYKDKLFNSICRILKQFYDEDILEEEVIIEWSQKGSKKYVSKEMSKKIHEKAAPFIKWLKEAEVDSDDDDQDDDDEDGEEDSTEEGAKKSPPAEKQTASTKSSAPATGKAAGKGAAAAAASANSNQRRRSLDDDEDEDDGIDLEFSHRVSGIQIVETVKTSSAPKAVNAGVAESASSGNQADDDIDIDNI